MALNSFAFLLVFLPLTAAFVMLMRQRFGVGAAQKVLLGSSLVFYASTGVWNLALLIASITFNWGIARRLVSKSVDPSTRKPTLVFALIVNVAVLCVFKYAALVPSVAGKVFGVTLAVPALGFPLGLSFFTLTQVMYLVDCYEGQIGQKSWFEHATFVALFTNVTAGPLLRAKLFYSQIGNLGARDLRKERLIQSAALVCMGLLKKVVLGDSFAKIASAGYANVDRLSTLEGWVTVFAGAFEIYFDFSGYSDMAFGCGGLLGLSLVRNFNTPFRALTISDFWKRWHISLSQFITTYLYTPILRSMGKATVNTSALATLIAMLVAGVWHGAAWKYVVFGLLHGAALAGSQYWKLLKWRLPRSMGVSLTFLFVSLSFVSVRAQDLDVAARLVARLAPHQSLLSVGVLVSAIARSDLRMLVGPTLVGCLLAFIGPTAEALASRFRPSYRSDALVICMLMIAYVFMSAGGAVEFRYRQF